MTAPATQIDADLLTVDDLRALTQLGRDHVYRLLETGEIKSLRIGRQYRVPRSEYEAWKQRALKASTPQPISIPITLAAPRGRGQRTETRR
ncbi:helix-turn-helix domain-containing protein [Deinococcus multiflagellatus]|uniref:Helix-turn-helix domain-containing protein n=1 Tax=Deinococcus multiflagellatus TaxID=1656887 RepID=A0ABW1ZHR3_9DEIO|nr:helix-turn-helix domain-containing protein [Deinococcus multiflagellatus]MBZ9713795.1 helix-turn-helix domain-containing protein [Deinococcus multiflagellatus]